MLVAGGYAGILGCCVSLQRVAGRVAGRLAEARRAFLRFSSEPPTSGSAERRGVRVTSSPRSEYADVTDMFRRVMTLDEQSIEYKRQRDVIIERMERPTTRHPHRRTPRRRLRSRENSSKSWNAITKTLTLPVGIKIEARSPTRHSYDLKRWPARSPRPPLEPPLRIELV
jgi:hypothetical protein